MSEIYKIKYADELKNIIVSTDVKKIIVHGDDGKSVSFVKETRGRWRLVTKPSYTFDGYRCSECAELVYGRTNFCPKCGADMRGDDDE